MPGSNYVTPTFPTAQSFSEGVRNDLLPWKTGDYPWTDSVKEQYFSMLNAEQANQHEIEMWRLNNEYNTPRKQMERMVEAGINPAAAYQQISSGNASSAPGVHESKTPSWRDTTDKLARINTILSGISDIMSTVENGINAAQGVQGMALVNQNNWYDQMRANAFKTGFYPYLTNNRNDISGDAVQVAPGLYASGSQIQMFPELYSGFKGSFAGGNYDLGVQARNDQHSLVERRNRIDNLMQEIFTGFDQGYSSDKMLNLFLQLIAYGLQQRVGGGF